MEEDQASLAVGTVMFAISIPDPWPVAVPSTIVEVALTDGSLHVGCLPSGQLEAALAGLIDGKVAVLDRVQSPILRVSPNQPVVITIVWENRKFAEFELNRHDLIAPNPVLVVKDTPSPTEPPDFTGRNGVARLNRYSMQKNLPVNPRRKAGGKGYLFASLQGEVEQIEDLIEAIERGREAHVPGLASRLRLLVSGKPLGPLQHCAAFDQSPLIVFTDNNPEALPPVTGGTWLGGTPAPEANRANPCPVDLDVWLKFPALKVGDRVYSHLEAIKDIGDTIGSHRDEGIPQSVLALQVTRSQNSRNYRDVQRYVTSVARTILVLCQSLISQAGAPASGGVPEGEPAVRK